jgi:hypothetical protein
MVPPIWLDERIQTNRRAINSMIWLWGLAVGLLLGTILGVVLARRPHRQRDQRSRGGTVTDWGQSLAQVTELRREISRLRQANARLQTDRAETLAALARVADSLEREVRRRPVQAIQRALGEGTDTSPRPPFAPAPRHSPVRFGPAL